MSDDAFFARWSRRKRSGAAADTRVELKKDDGSVGRGADPGAASSTQTRSFDPQNLPPLDSISSDSDIRAFLADGVPAELTRAALRRLWASDPNIRDFVGLSENSWDFNTPGSIAGFGAIDKEQVGRALAQLLGGTNTETDPGNENVETKLASSERDQKNLPVSAFCKPEFEVTVATNDATKSLEVAPLSQHASASKPVRRRGSALPR